MKDLTNNTFTYAGKKYTLVVMFMLSNSSKKDDIENIPLDNTLIKKIKISNQFNQLCLKAEIEYQDNYGHIDKVLDKQFSYCSISLVRHNQKVDGKITVDKTSKTDVFQHIFLVENVKIASRQGHTIDYKIDLISMNWINCIENVTYSNYDKPPMEIFDIIKACFAQKELMIDKTTFDEIKSNVNLNYITNGNDNVFTVVKYLLNKLYYYNTKTDSIKTILYNETTDKYQLFDFKNMKRTNGNYPITLSMFKSQNEQIVEEQQNQLATVVEMPNSEYIRSVFDYEMSNYSFEENTFSSSLITGKSLVNYINAHADATDYYDRYNTIWKDHTGLTRGSYWNNEVDMYGYGLDALMKLNSLVINTSGEILRKPGSLVAISLDRSLNTVTEADRDNLEETKNKYLAFEGLWIVNKVLHILEPQKQIYRQNLTLSRNFRVKTK